MCAGAEQVQDLFAVRIAERPRPRAGVLLGFMSLKTRSIWLGAALHISVAWVMDFASLYRRGLNG